MLCIAKQQCPHGIGLVIDIIFIFGFLYFTVRYIFTQCDVHSFIYTTRRIRMCLLTYMLSSFISIFKINYKYILGNGWYKFFFFYWSLSLHYYWSYFFLYRFIYIVTVILHSDIVMIANYICNYCKKLF